jgi:hypothetical protein
MTQDHKDAEVLRQAAAILRRRRVKKTMIGEAILRALDNIALGLDERTDHLHLFTEDEYRREAISE